MLLTNVSIEFLCWSKPKIWADPPALRGLPAQDVESALDIIK
jgi:hypothetical protein